MTRTVLTIAMLLGILAAVPALGQETAGRRESRQVEIVRADSLVGRMENGENIRSLIGSVFLRQGKTELWANQATQYLDRDKIFFVGDVMIVDEGDSLTADTIWYDTRTKIGTATGRVELFDGEVVVTSPSGRYHVDEEFASFDQGVRLVDSASVLVSARGQYFTEEKRAEFIENVRLDEDRSHMEADTVSYMRETEISIARGRVFIQRLGGDEEEDEPVDSTRLTLLFGTHAYNDNEARYSRVEGNPLVVQLRRDTTDGTIDTTLVRARLIEVSRSDSLERVIARDSVRLWQPDMAAAADSVVFDRLAAGADSVRHTEIRMFTNPVIWSERSQITGDSLRMVGRDEDIDTVFVRNNAFVAQEDSLLKRIHQIRGLNLTGLFREDSLRTLFIGPNAEMVYYLVTDDDQPDGAVKSSGDEAEFTFSGGKPSRVVIKQGTEGTYFPEHLLPSDINLSGFQWMPERRPEKAALLDHPGAGRLQGVSMAGQGPLAIHE